MTTPNPLAKTKGAGTTFWMYTGKGDAFANPLSNSVWKYHSPERDDSRWRR